MENGLQIAAYVGLILAYGLLLFLAVRQRISRGRVQKLLEATLLLAAVWTVVLGSLALLWPGGWLAFIWHRVAHYGVVLLALLTAEFTAAFVERRSRRELRLAVVGLLLLGAVALDMRLFSWLNDPFPVPLLRLGLTELATLFLMAAWVVSTGAGWWTSGGAVREASGSKHRNRIRYLQVALLSFTLGDLLLFVGSVPGVYVGLAGRLLGFSVVTFALLRYDLPDLRRLGLGVVRVVVMAGLTAALYLAVLLAVGLVAGRVVDLPPVAAVVPALVVAVTIAAVIDLALRSRLNRFFDRTVLGQRYNMQKALRAYGEQVGMILDLERLADTTLDWLRTTLRVERSAFVLFSAQREGWTELRVVRAMGSPEPAAQSFSPDSRFITHFSKIGRPLSQYDLDMLSWFQGMRGEEREWLKGLGVDLYVPVLVAEKPVALLAVGSKGGRQPYSDEDVETLVILASQAATAVENARLVEDLRGLQADLQRLNSELAETNRQLQRLDQVKADFVTIASHELRTPLSQIFGYSDVLASLEGEELSDAQATREFIGGITRGARRLKRVVDEMVDVSLIETGALKIRLATVVVGEIVQSAVESVQSTAAKREVSIKVGDLSRLPYILADSVRLEQVFISLVNNAVKFTPDGGQITVSGRLMSASGDGGYVEVQVADQGIGIDADQRALIFEKFYRPESPLLHSTDDIGFKGAGPGLGLAIARGIVEAHGGRIWVESPGRDEKTFPGSSFYVRLPVNGPGEGGTRA